MVVAALDPTPEAGGGASVLRMAGIDVEHGLLEAPARELNAPFFHAAVSDTPWTTLKIAMSLDGAIADARGTTTWLTSEESRAEVHQLRAGNDSVSVGVGTVIADAPQLTARGAPPPLNPPARVVFDRSLRTPPTARVVATARETPTIIVTTQLSSPRAAELRDAGVQLVAGANLGEGLHALRALGIRSIMIEGGATINAAVMQENLAHRLIIFQAPVLLGPKALHAFDGASGDVLRALESAPVLERHRSGPDMVTTYVLAEL